MEIDQRIFMDSQFNDEHKKQFKKVTILGKQLMHCLGPESSLFLEYESSVGILNNFYIKSAYDIGLEHGKKLAQLKETS